MKKNLLLLVMVLSFCTTFAGKIGAPVLKGFIDDASCAGTCAEKTRVACANRCFKGGSPAVLVVDKKVYKISNQKEAEKFLGKNVEVEGKITEDSIEITKVTEVK